MRTPRSRASPQSKTSPATASAENTKSRGLPPPRSPAVRDPQIPIGALAKRSPHLPAVSSLGGFRTPAPAPRHTVAKGRRSKPSYEGPEVNCQLLVSVNSGLKTGTRPANLVSGGIIRSRTTIPASGKRSSLRRVQSSHRRPDGPSGFCGDRQPSTSLGESELKAGLMPLSSLLRRE
jgi:hypothetical protein